MIEIKNMTIEEVEEAKKTGYVAVFKGYKIEELCSELKSVWSTFSDEARDSWAMILGGLNGKSEIMALMNNEDDR